MQLQHFQGDQKIDFFMGIHQTHGHSSRSMEHNLMVYLSLRQWTFLMLFNRSWIKCKECYSQSQNNNCVQYLSWHKHHEKTHVWKEHESFL
jgi:hypothetical protein